VTGPSHQDEQKERVRVLLQDHWRDRRALRDDITVANERANATTYSVFTESELNAEEGRFKKSTQVVGTRVAAEYPRLPSDSFPAQASAVPNTEPPLGINVNYVEPCGTEPEILRSLSHLPTTDERSRRGEQVSEDGEGVAQGTVASSPATSDSASAFLLNGSDIGAPGDDDFLTGMKSSSSPSIRKRQL
jgi:hypothetical protein